MTMTVDTVLATVALISSWFWGTQGWLTAKKLRDLQIELAEKDLNARRIAEQATRQGAIRVDLTKGPDTLVVTNDGQGIASDVWIDVTGRDGNNPVGQSIEGRLPIQHIHPGESRTFSAYVLWEFRPVFDVEVRWTNPDGTPGKLNRELHADSHLR